MTSEQGLGIPLIADLKTARAEVGESTLEGENIQCAIDLLEAQAAENAELRAEVERLGCRSIEHEMRFDAEEAKADHWKARALAAETALATAREALTEISNAPVPDSTSPARPSIGWLGFPGFKVIAQRALKTKEPSHG